MVKQEPDVKGNWSRWKDLRIADRFESDEHVATMFVTLKPWDERRGKDQTLEAILGRVNKKLGVLKEAVVFGFNLPEIPGLGITSGLELNLQQRTGDDVQAFAREVNGFVADAKKIPSLQNVATSFRARGAATFRDS